MTTTFIIISSKKGSGYLIAGSAGGELGVCLESDGTHVNDRRPPVSISEHPLPAFEC